MEKDAKVLVIALGLLVVMSFFSFSFTGSFVKSSTRGFDEKSPTDVLISADGRTFTDRFISVDKGQHIYFRVNTGDPFGTRSLVKFFWYPSDLDAIKKDKVYSGYTYIKGCGKTSCRGGKVRDVKYLALGLKKGLNCAHFKDRGFNEEVKVCFKIK
tara:strand:- start:30580 stop:31047 length:468 start_codon:yes stop_codon:yes gene_type:complete